MNQIEKRPPRLIRQCDLGPLYGLHWKTTRMWELVKSGKFPEPIRFKDGGRGLGWMSDEIEQWLEDRRAERDARQAERNKTHQEAPAE